jgi:putative MATE family efflux protein
VENIPKSSNTKLNKNVELLLGDYKKAVITLSIPNMIAMLIQTLYNLVDAVWVAGLGPSSLAAMGLFFPIYMIVISIATGIAVGTSSAIARRIGAKDFEGANSVAEHSIILAIIVGFLTTVVGILSLGFVLKFTGASGLAMQKAQDYGFIIFLSSIFTMFNNSAIGILRGEGDSKRPMYIVLFSSVLNMVLDPIFIYAFKFGIEGAAWATNISIFVASTMLLYLLIFSKKTFLNVTFKGFSLDREILYDISVVGFPTALAQITMSVAIYFLNFFAAKAAGDLGVATFTGAWRIINLGTLTIIGVSSAVTTVTGAAYGAKDIKKLEGALNYAIKFAEYFAIGTMLVIFFFSKPLALMFSYSKSSSLLLENVSQALKILCMFLPGTPFGMLTSGMFQGIGHGYKSLVTTILRTIIFQVFWTWIFVDGFRMGLTGVWLGIVIGNTTASIITYTWGRLTIKKLYLAYAQRTHAVSED